MQFGLVARFVLVLFGEADDFDGPRHAACAQHIHHSEIVEAHWKVQGLQNACVAASGDFSLIGRSNEQISHDKIRR